MDTHLERPVAVKLFEEDVEFEDVFREARVHARTDEHDHVVTIRDVKVEIPRPYVVMELCEAGSVQDRLDAGEVTLLEALRWTRDGLAGLAHVHALEIIHRDVKPANWLLKEGGRVAVSDFGLAEDTIRRVRTEEGVYYLPHLAPEVRDAGTSRRSDIWAVGCTLYRLLTGEYPFEDEDAAAAGQFEAPHRKNLQVPMSLTRVVERALQVTPEDRYPNALAMQAALNDCRVAASWRKVDQPHTIETWVTSIPSADYRIELVERPRVGLELTAFKDVRSGAGFIRARRDRPPSLARARHQALRRWLVEVVEGGRL
jgi:eukaryotic-like serine/threonine-protein kinase